MPKFPMTPVGVTNALDQLYTLSDSLLKSQSEDIQTNFIEWIKDNFLLDDTQAIYVNRINNSAAEYYGRQCAICFDYRLPIFLIYPLPPAPGYAKWTVTENNLKVDTNSQGEITVTGSFIFRIEYR